jgi:hypothetical protein
MPMSGLTPGWGMLGSPGCDAEGPGGGGGGGGGLPAEVVVLVTAAGMPPNHISKAC